LNSCRLSPIFSRVKKDDENSNKRDENKAKVLFSLLTHKYPRHIEVETVTCSISQELIIISFFSEVSLRKVLLKRRKSGEHGKKERHINNINMIQNTLSN